MLKILLVEDNEMNRDMLSRRLKRRGYQVVIAVNGSEGVSMSISEHPDLVLMDMSLPVMDGWEATRQLKANEQTKSIPVLALTAHAMSGDREKALEAGCDDYDTKPIELPRLLSKIEELLARDNESPVEEIEEVSSSATVEAIATASDFSEENNNGKQVAVQGTILVVNEDENNRDLLSQQIERLGYAVTAAANSQQALEKIEGGNYDLLLLDPTSDTDSCELLERLNSSEVGRNLPAIAILAWDQIDSAAKYIKRGAVDYLPKPFNPTLLQTRISTCLENKRLRNQELEYQTQLSQTNAELEGKNKLIRQIFGRYLSDEVVADLLASPSQWKLDGEQRQVTLLTADLRRFTLRAEQLPPKKAIELLNLYLKSITEVISQYQGTIDGFLGDLILVVFGVPNSTEDDTRRAVACAVAMQSAMASVNEKVKEWGLLPLEMGIGINTGKVVVGSMSLAKNTKYGVVGRQVNLTYSIASYTKGGQILISQKTLKDAGSIVKIKGQKQIQPQGVKQPLTIYEVRGIDAEYDLFFSQEGGKNQRVTRS